jgi:hypothetical protein
MSCYRHALRECTVSSGDPRRKEGGPGYKRKKREELARVEMRGMGCKD